MVRGKFVSTKARRSGLESTTYLTRQFGKDEKFLSRFGPQYPQPICANTVPFVFISPYYILLCGESSRPQILALFWPLPALSESEPWVCVSGSSAQAMYQPSLIALEPLSH